jgi:hypothetical protein
MKPQTSQVTDIQERVAVNASPAPSSGAIIPFPNVRVAAKSAQLDTMPTASKAASAPTKHPRFLLSYAGKKWRIFKRPGSPAWYLVFQKDGKRFLHSLGDSTREVASETAKVKIRAWKEGRLDVLRRSMERPGEKQFARLAEVFAAVEAMPGDAKASTRHNYVMALRWVLRKVHPQRDPDTLTAAVFGDDTAREFWSWAKREAQEMNQQQRNTHARNCHSIWLMAAAIVAPKNLSLIEREHHFPDTKVWREAAKKFGFGKIASDEGFDRPPWAIIRRVWTEWVRMGRDANYPAPDPNETWNNDIRLNCFRSIGLMLAFGLRKNEVSQAQAEWLTTDEHGPLLRAEAAQVKNKTGRIKVRALDPFYTILRRHGKLPAAGHLLTGAYACDRTYWPYYHVGKFMRALGWTTQKTNHALRDLSASLIITKFGVDRAKVWARHSSVMTTEAHYSRFVDNDAAAMSKNLFPWLRFAVR